MASQTRASILRACRAEGRGSAAAEPQALQRGGVHSAVSISHQMSPSAAKGAPCADNGRAGRGAGCALPKAAPLLTPTAWRSPSACPSSLWRGQAAGCCRLGSLPYRHHLLHVSLVICLTPHFSRMQDSCHLLQEAFPGLPLPSSHT